MYTCMHSCSKYRVLAIYICDLQVTSQPFHNLEKTHDLFTANPLPLIAVYVKTAS